MTLIDYYVQRLSNVKLLYLIILINNVERYLLTFSHHQTEVLYAGSRLEQTFCPTKLKSCLFSFTEYYLLHQTGRDRGFSRTIWWRQKYNNQLDRKILWSRHRYHFCWYVELMIRSLFSKLYLYSIPFKCACSLT